ncbi:unnamed protein product [Rangifer tarandus platyrhynchus]|uniref:Uncharacterized protein n=2 Tax=Rangifer tarandus platyrhynchus TaxID=3082113 RepID=A0ABN8YXR2_RANTA|nr:unnamed protein product [Rangifer tarandus platyrhynchus]CAI9694214.1 unnamed protein product [Rangifer tarandus platyrhynchus]
MASLQHVEIILTSGSRGVRERLRAGRGKPVSCPWWLRRLDVRPGRSRRGADPRAGGRHFSGPSLLATQPVCAGHRLQVFVCTALGRKRGRIPEIGRK